MKKGELTQLKILECSALLFAEQGYAGTTIRQIALSANVNVASVSMYFESKQGLYKRIVEDGFEDLSKRRERALDECTAGHNASLNEVLEAFVSPLFELQDVGGRESAFLRILARTLFEPDAIVAEAIQKKTGEVANRFVREIRRRTPQLTLRQIRARFRFSVGAIGQMLIDANRPSGKGAKEELIKFLTAAFSG